MTMEAVVRGGAFTGIASKVLALFYLAEPDTIFGRCCEVDDSIETLLLIGHNPGWSEAAILLGKTPLSLGTAQAALLEYSGQGGWAEAIYDHQKWSLRGIVP
jgi:phosphohistidine phosphatase SixA